MTNPQRPESEPLGAYLDGELDERRRRQVEESLAANPDVEAELEALRELRKLYRETTPPEPSAAKWDRIRHQLQRAVPPRRKRRTWVALLAVACLAFAIWAGARWLPPRSARVGPNIANEVLPVATADEVVILHVDGADTASLVVGRLPMHGPMELADPGDVVVTEVKPDARDRMVPLVRDAARRPMIWARLESEIMSGD